MENLERVLWVALMVAQSLLILRLITEKLFRRYPFFTGYLSIDLIAGLILILIPFHSLAYSEAFRIYGFTISILRLGVAAELYERICQHLSGIGRLRFYLAGGLAALAMLATVSTITPELGDQWRFPHTVVNIVRRFQGETLGATFLLLWVFLRYVLHLRPIRLRSNVANHWRILTVYFTATAVHAFAILASGGGKAVHPLNAGLLVVDLGCVFAWLKTFSQEGETLPERASLSKIQLAALETKNRDLVETIRSLRQ